MDGQASYVCQDPEPLGKGVGTGNGGTILRSPRETECI